MKMTNVIVIGAGMGGLSTALKLAQSGCHVRVIEARDNSGGLASSFSVEGFKFDAGPYILLDRPGLDWAFKSLGIDLEANLKLLRIDDVYKVSSHGNPTIQFHSDVERTASGFEALWPGSAERYLKFVQSTAALHNSLCPMLHLSRPGFGDLLRTGAWRQAPFLLRSLNAVLSSTGLPQPVTDAIGIWTHIAGQRAENAPSPLAFVPALIHTSGAYYPLDGMGAIPRILESNARKAGVEFQYGEKVTRVRCESGRVSGVETVQHGFIPADAVVSNHSGVGTYVNLVENIPEAERQRVMALPLQSPGVCAYLAIKGSVDPTYLHFQLPGNGELCRLLIRPAALAPELKNGEWSVARLLAPMLHSDAEKLGANGQREFLDRVLAERWWREGISDVRVMATRIPHEWGSQFNLYRDSMNPVMTAQFMRQGRLAHRSPNIRGLYLTGSSTHPGQWVSFCAISGILAADQLMKDSHA